MVFLSLRVLYSSENYYPFQGKAFAEDLILSFLFKRVGASLFIANNIVAETSLIASSYTLSNLRSKLYLLKFSTIRFRHLRFIISLLIRLFALKRIF